MRRVGPAARRALEDCPVYNPAWDGGRSPTGVNKADYVLSSVSPSAGRKMSNTNKTGSLYYRAWIVEPERTSHFPAQQGAGIKVLRLNRNPNSWVS